LPECRVHYPDGPSEQCETPFPPHARSGLHRTDGVSCGFEAPGCGRVGLGDQVGVKDSAVVLFSRNKKSLSKKFPYIVEALAAVLPELATASGQLPVAEASMCGIFESVRNCGQPVHSWRFISSHELAPDHMLGFTI